MFYKVPFVDFAAEYNLLKEELDTAIADVISRGDLILRKDVDDFETNIAKWLGVKEVVSVASGTDALFLTLKALGIGPGDEVITCSYTFRATIEAIIHTGARPVLTDIGEGWKKYRTSYTKAIIPCHLEGKTVDWVSDGISMIEDSCQAIGAKPLTGLAACYSFYPAKILGCLGDGGAVATNDTELANYLRCVRNHDKDRWTEPAYNSRLDNLQAAILNVRLKHLDEILAARRWVAEKYEALEGVKKPEKRLIYQDYVVGAPEGLKEYLDEKGIQTMTNGYPFPQGHEKGPKTKEYEATTLRLPCNETLTEDQVDYVIKCINEYGLVQL